MIWTCPYPHLFESGTDPVSKTRGGRFQYHLVVKSHVITASLCKRDKVYFTTLLWQNNGRQNVLISRMLFSEFYKFVVRKHILASFRGGDRPNRPLWIRPWFEQGQKMRKWGEIDFLVLENILRSDLAVSPSWRPVAEMFLAKRLKKLVCGCTLSFPLQTKLQFRWWNPTFFHAGALQRRHYY